ncbi:MAG TPA: WecB/TagA/CpsF family glycosyltransferase [Planctomycetes bacterium]|nr:WecB/TagA/CpsF family glycosyltransferase [Planctomycetota bacterium]
MTASGTGQRFPWRPERGMSELPEVGLFGTGLHPLSTSECTDLILDELDRGRGGWLFGADLDVLLRCARDPEQRDTFESASLRVPVGTLLLWACRLQRTPLPERVQLFELVELLVEEAAACRRSVFLIAEDSGTLTAAAKSFQERHPELRIVGCSPAPGSVQGDPIEMARLSRAIDEARPDLVFVGIESQVQEELISFLRHDRPEAWWLGVNGALRILAGERRPAPRWMQRTGLEAAHALFHEPKRYFGKYILRGLPWGAWLLAKCALEGALPKGKDEGRYGPRAPRALLVDDDPFALDHLELLLSSRFPDLEIEKRTEPDAGGRFDFYFLDNDFHGDHLAARLAGSVRAEHPTATIIAFSGVLDVDTLKQLINLGCDGMCDKSDPASWRPILDMMEAKLQSMVERHRLGRHAFGGVRHSAYSIHRLLREWNEREGAAVGSNGEDAR